MYPESKFLHLPSFNAEFLQHDLDTISDDREFMYVVMASAMRIAFPSTFKELRIDKSILASAPDQLDELRNADLPVTRTVDFSTFAVALQILSADEVKITHEGIQFIAGKREVEIPASPLPEKRRF